MISGSCRRIVRCGAWDFRSPKLEQYSRQFIGKETPGRRRNHESSLRGNDRLFDRHRDGSGGLRIIGDLIMKKLMAATLLFIGLVWSTPARATLFTYDISLTMLAASLQQPLYGNVRLAAFF